jgi:hypothetical protein
MSRGARGLQAIWKSLLTIEHIGPGGDGAGAKAARAMAPVYGLDIGNTDRPDAVTGARSEANGLEPFGAVA